jgi:ribosomal protein S18 acetylase RimI-like enzyme
MRAQQAEQARDRRIGALVARAGLPRERADTSLSIMQPYVIRRATRDDLPCVSRMGAALTRSHQAFDVRRFLLVEGLEAGYEKWLGSIVDDPETALLAAESGGELIGYCVGRIEPRDWVTLIDRHGALHEVWVVSARRGHGVGQALVRAVCQELGRLGAPRVVLWCAWQNVAAQNLFEQVGFRRTMLEMTRELA